MKFAFIIMGNFNSKQDCASIKDGAASIIGVSSLEEACQVAKKLQENGIDCIELCGAFEEAGARAVIEATQNKLPIGYITHLPEQDTLFDEVFG